MNVSREKICYNALLRVFRDGAYSSLALDDAFSEFDPCGEEEFITRLFYGVIERNITLEYVIGKLVAKMPKPAVFVIMKMGVYMIRYMRVPDYAAVDRCVELAKVLGKRGVGGFINAVLRKASGVELPSLGEVGDTDYLAVVCGVPKWLSEKLIAAYGFDFTRRIFESEEFRTHIRLSPSADKQKIETALKKCDKSEYEQTEYGYYVTHNTLDFLLKNGFLRKSDFAVQSLSSAAAAYCYADGLNGSSFVVDLCAAPGGKAVCVKQLTSCNLIACDIHPHRVRLIESYAGRMGVEISVEQNDACVKREEWAEKFDCVICDVPCSGSGDVRSKPDILLRRNGKSVSELSKLQRAILVAASGYVKPGGKLCYSTCSILPDENESVISDFLSHHSEYALEDCSPFADRLKKPNVLVPKDASEISPKCMRIFPGVHNADGFFAAVMRKSENRVKEGGNE